MEHTNNLNTKAMLVSLNISCWIARKLDKKESKKLTEQHGVVDNAARVLKNLLPENYGSYKKIMTALTAARQEHNKKTLPWIDGGTRILLASNYEQYTGTMRPLRTDFDSASHEFVKEYPTLYKSSKDSLKTLWKEDDYPSVTDIPSKFGFSIKVLPLPQAEDFRVNLGTTDVEAIQEQIRDNTKAAIAEAMKDPFRRLHEVVFRMAQKLGDKKGKFHDTLITNIEEVVGLLPSLNLTNDPELTKMGAKIIGQLAQYEPETLRTDPKRRKTIAQQADQICNDLAAFMGGSDG